AGGPSGPRRLLLVAMVAASMTIVAGAAPSHAADDAGRTVRTAAAGGRDECEPVPVPEPTEKAMQFYRGNNVLWVINQAWAILLTGGLAFSGLSARMRALARRLGGNWFLTVGIYVILYLAVVFAITLPLSFYQGFIRLHAYGLSNQTLGKWSR